MARSQAQVLFDSDCGICTWTARAIDRLDGRGRLRIVPFEVARREGLGADLTDDLFFAAFHVVVGGRVESGARAIPSVLERLPLGSRPASWIRRSGVLSNFVERSYAWIARNRFRLGPLGCRPHSATSR